MCEDKKEEKRDIFDAKLHKNYDTEGKKQERRTKCKNKNVRSERRKEEWRYLREEPSTSA